MQNVNLENKIRGSVIALASGDALGAPVEMKSARRIRKRYPNGLRDFKKSRHFPSVGYTTDDTALSVCMAEALIAKGEYDQEVAFEHYLHWFNLDGTGMGSNTKFVFKSAEGGKDPAVAAQIFREMRPERAVSNGSLMRMAPLAIRYRDNLQKLELFTKQDSMSTHASHVAAEACWVYNQILVKLLKGEDPESVTSDMPVVQAILTADKSTVKSMVASGRGMVLVSLAAAVWAIRSGLSLEEALIKIVSWGGDTDSHAAIAGALLGAKYGLEKVPDRWFDKLVDRDYFLELATQLEQLPSS